MLTIEQKNCLSILIEIHKKVLKAFKYIHEREDTWSPRLPTWDGEPFSGNCGEFALCCIQECKKHGLPARMLVVKREQGDWHGVCEVNGWLLDSTKSTVMRQDDYDGYVFWAISGFNHLEPWHFIDGH